MQFLMVRIIIPEKAKFNVFFFYKKGYVYIYILRAFKFNFGSCESLLETTACRKRETWAKPLKHNIGGRHVIQNGMSFQIGLYNQRIN